MWQCDTLALWLLAPPLSMLWPLRLSRCWVGERVRWWQPAAVHSCTESHSLLWRQTNSRLIKITRRLNILPWQHDSNSADTFARWESSNMHKLIAENNVYYSLRQHMLRTRAIWRKHLIFSCPVYLYKIFLSFRQLLLLPQHNDARFLRSVLRVCFAIMMYITHCVDV